MSKVTEYRRHVVEVFNCASIGALLAALAVASYDYLPNVRGRAIAHNPYKVPMLSATNQTTIAVIRFLSDFRTGALSPTQRAVEKFRDQLPPDVFARFAKIAGAEHLGGRGIISEDDDL